MTGHLGNISPGLWFAICVGAFLLACLLLNGGIAFMVALEWWRDRRAERDMSAVDECWLFADIAFIDAAHDYLAEIEFAAAVLADIDELPEVTA